MEGIKRAWTKKDKEGKYGKEGKDGKEGKEGKGEYVGKAKQVRR